MPQILNRSLISLVPYHRLSLADLPSPASHNPIARREDAGVGEQLQDPSHRLHAYATVERFKFGPTYCPFQHHSRLTLPLLRPPPSRGRISQHSLHSTPPRPTPTSTDYRRPTWHGRSWTESFQTRSTSLYSTRSYLLAPFGPNRNAVQKNPNLPLHRYTRPLSDRF